MITNLTLRNFKSYQNTSVRLRPLNILAGVNGMGKSSLIQSLLLLRQSHQKGNFRNTGLSLRGPLVDIGMGRDALHRKADEREGLGFDLKFSSNHEHTYAFEYDARSDILPTRVMSFSEDDAVNISLYNYNFQYLNVEHIGPKVAYDMSDHVVRKERQLGIKGEFTPHYLAEYEKEEIQFQNLIHKSENARTLIHQVNAHMGEISPGSKIVSTADHSLAMVRMAYSYEDELSYMDDFKPTNVGFGMSYSLPVIVSLLTASPEKLLIIENPESHLHPRGQSFLGHLIAKAAQNDMQIIAETHSDHILNGVRVAVKEGFIDSDRINILYFHRERGKSESLISTIRVDRQGELSDYPEGFLDEWNVQLMKLL